MLGVHANDQAVEKRHFLRARYNEPVRYHFRDSGKFGGCVARDISEGGIRLDLDDFVPLNSEMILQMKFHDSPMTTDVKGRVVWLQQVPYSDRYHVGFQFVETNPLAKEGIRNYVKSHRF
ncbi:MAG TPA: PilZ domain-containing protein [Candidatus Omnitrophota bacterium]|nr:PilZ domain-containing protein [Candidatus Omnitrophota bacterium]HPD83895.1 PilZ domain-containing protein [Candidatus Omnitrophota bacterium]HRZ02752.1 PilZ domain-containing protein [Candidatus Omnitrophota bacterium]